MRATLNRAVTLVGIGLHSGRPVRLEINPSDQGGIWFRRTDIKDCSNVVAARFDRVSDTTLCTKLTNDEGVSVATVEHIMAAFSGTGVTDVVVDIDGPEVPIMDGSSKRFVSEILKVGLRSLTRKQEAIRILKSVRVDDGDVWAELSPDDEFSIDFLIEFPETAIGRQSKSLPMRNGAFVHELADCRTFCRRSDVEAMQSAGLALGGTLDNAIVVEGAEILNPEGLRRSDEFVRHKMLDALGDLGLAGAPIVGAYRASKAGHGVTNRLLRKLFATPDAWEIIAVDDVIAARLPGAGVDRTDLREAG